MIVRTIRSEFPAERWEDAMVSGNGSTGIMVMGRPLEERVIINHEKLWVVMANTAPRVPDLSAAWAEARNAAFEGRFRDAMEGWNRARRAATAPLLEEEGTADRHRVPYDKIHPGLHLNFQMKAGGKIGHYSRETTLTSGEIRVAWSDTAGPWERRSFVSRTDDVIAMHCRAPIDAALNCQLSLSEAPGKGVGDMGAATIRHAEQEMYFHAAYGRTMGKPVPEGYQLLARVVPCGGESHVVENQGVNLTGADEVLLIMRLVYLDDASATELDALRASLAALPADYDALLARHEPVHREMFKRVTLDLNSSEGDSRSTEELIADSHESGASARLLEALHAVGRYAHICAGTGALPLALSGIWGNDWDAPWDGRYTFDANINLAISGASQGALPELIDTYLHYIERSLDDWRFNAGQLFGCRGILPDLCQGWRHGKALMLYPWVGGAGWLVSYLYDHYRYTGDKAFLRERVLPLMEEVARFYEDFLAGTEGEDGRVRFYPSVSPENFPIMADKEQESSVVPNATCDIAICREALANVIEASRELGTESEEVRTWEALLDRLPDYRINRDGALAEWAYPGMGDRYNHRHSSHLYPLWPSLEFSPERGAELFDAARKAVEKRQEAGFGNKSSHGYLHLCLVAARLRDPELLWYLLDDYARQQFFNSSMITCHNPGLMIYNLDGTFALPSVLTKMLLHSEEGLLLLLPALPTGRLSSGTVRGLCARGGVRVEELKWNILTHDLVIQLRAKTAQHLALDCASPLRSVKPAESCDHELNLQGGDRTVWELDLPADTSIRLRCSL